jgi:hypothetical protein
LKKGKDRKHFGKVGMRFVCDRIIDSFLNNNDGWFVELGCLTPKEINEYQGDKAILYGWHITDLVVYDEPREWREFATVDNEAVQNCNHRVQNYYDGFCKRGCLKCGFYCSAKDDWCDKCKTKPITRPPQSWQFCVATEPRQTAD